MRILVFSLILKLSAAVSPSAFAAAPDLCARLLNPISMQNMSHRKLPPLGLHHPELGLPQTNAEAGAAALLLTTEDTITFESDLGPSIWRRKELENWFRLMPITLNPQIAQQEIQIIGQNALHCPPGLATDICRELRSSRLAQKAAIAQFGVERPEDPGTMRKFYKLRKKVHEQMGLQSFPWGTWFSNWPATMSEEQAFAVMRVLSRDTLIRHIQFKGLDGKLHLGHELPFETRLMLASLPALVAAMPLFEIYPLDLSPNIDFGEANLGNEMDLFRIRWPNSSMPVHLYLTVDLGRSQLDNFAIYFSFDTKKEIGEREVQTFAKNAIGTLNQQLAQFRKSTLMTKGAYVECHWNDKDESLDVNLRGMSEANQLLFFYFLASHLNPQI